MSKFLKTILTKSNDLADFVNLYKKFGIEVVVNYYDKGKDSFFYIRLESNLNNNTNTNEITLSDKFLRFHKTQPYIKILNIYNAHTVITFDKEGKFINQSFYNM